MYERNEATLKYEHEDHSHEIGLAATDSKITNENPIGLMVKPRHQISISRGSIIKDRNTSFRKLHEDQSYLSCERYKIHNQRTLGFYSRLADTDC